MEINGYTNLFGSHSQGSNYSHIAGISRLTNKIRSEHTDVFRKYDMSWKINKSPASLRKFK